MDFTGENFVILSGYIKKPSFKVYNNEYGLYSAYINIPIGKTSKSLKISAKGDIADSLNELKEGTFIKIHGHIEERSYESNCKHCGGPEKKFWTDIQVDNFKIIN